MNKTTLKWGIYGAVMIAGGGFLVMCLSFIWMLPRLVGQIAYVLVFPVLWLWLAFLPMHSFEKAQWLWFYILPTIFLYLSISGFIIGTIIAKAMKSIGARQTYLFLLLLLLLSMAFVLKLFNEDRAKEAHGQDVLKAYEASIADYSKAIKLNPKDATAYFSRGGKKFQRGYYDGAIADFSKAIELDPNYSNAYHLRGWVESISANLDDSITDESKAIALDPTNAAAYSIRGAGKFNKGDLDGAIADESRAIELDPKKYFSYDIRGQAKKAKGDQVGADADFAKAANFRPPMPPSHPSLF